MRKVLIFLLLLTACQFTPPTKMPELPEINTGTSGVELSVSSLPDILMCSEADVVIGLKNLGSFDAKGHYNFIVEEQKIKPVPPKKGEFFLKGRSLINPVGGYDQVGLRLRSSELDEKVESYQTPVIFQACYKYSTVASVPVCIDPDVRNVNKNKVCTAQLVALSGGQGAPIAVTSVEPIMVPVGAQVQPGFIINMRNLGSGNVVAKDAAEAFCSGAGTIGSIVSVDAELQGVKLVCKPKILALEPDKDTEFSCVSELLYGVAQGTFTSVLSIELEYGYVNTATLPLTVKRLPGQTCKSDK